MEKLNNTEIKENTALDNKEEMVIEKYNTKSWLNSALSGFFIGLAVILPGISGSTIAILFKIYDKMLYSVGKIFKKFKQSFFYLLPIFVGALFGFVIGFFAVQSVIEKFTFIVVCIFGGLMIGSSPEIFMEVKDHIKKPKWYQIVLITLGFLFPIILSSTFANVGGLNSSEMFKTFPWWSYLASFAVGIAVSLTQLVPGLSASVLLMSIGFFQPIVESIHLSTLQAEPRWILFLLMMVVGFVVGFFLFSKVMSHFFTQHRLSTYFLITGLTFGSILSVFYNADVKEVYDLWTNGGGNMVLDLSVGIPLFFVFAALAFSLVIYQRKKDKEIEITK